MRPRSRRLVLLSSDDEVSGEKFTRDGNEEADEDQDLDEDKDMEQSQGEEDQAEDMEAGEPDEARWVTTLKDLVVSSYTWSQELTLNGIALAIGASTGFSGAPTQLLRRFNVDNKIGPYKWCIRDTNKDRKTAKLCWPHFGTPRNPNLSWKSKHGQRSKHKKGSKKLWWVRYVRARQ